jgi:hypothetical protein
MRYAVIVIVAKRSFKLFFIPRGKAPELFYLAEEALNEI